MASYSDKLLDARWQEKRLRVFERAGWKCEDCPLTKDDGISFHVHHGYYDRNLEPWEYDIATLHCLCSECHEKAEERKLRSAFALALLPGVSLDHLIGIAVRMSDERKLWKETPVMSDTERVGYDAWKRTRRRHPRKAA